MTYMGVFGQPDEKGVREHKGVEKDFSDSLYGG